MELICTVNKFSQKEIETARSLTRAFCILKLKLFSRLCHEMKLRTSAWTLGTFLDKEKRFAIQSQLPQAMPMAPLPYSTP